MSIESWQFAGFVALVVAVFYLLPRRLQNPWLLAASCVFYAWLGWQFLLVLAFLVGANLLIARRLAAHPAHPRAWLWAGIALNILTLVVFKYFDFFTPQVVAVLALLHLSIDSTLVSVVMPLGLSFTVLQTISFLVDVSRGQIDPLPGLLDFALYVAYFPKLTSGPIERARAFIPKLTQPRTVDNALLARSFSLLMVGLFRKIVIADQLAAIIPGNQFKQPGIASPTGWDSVIYLLGYGFYLFNDFAGYTSIVRGVSGFLGIELSQNFLTPYFSRSFTEFWNQWHITLSEWLRDYIYFPLTRTLLRHNANPRFVLTLVLPPMVTMLVSGMWHNLSLSMLIWGGLHGLFLVGERVITVFRPRRVGQPPLLQQVATGILVFVMVTLAWLPFNTTGPIRLWNYVLSISRPGAPSVALPVFNFIVFSLILDILQRRTRDELFFLKWPKPVQVALLTSACLLLVLLSAETLPKFVYQGY